MKKLLSQYSPQTLNAIFLVAGTCIGGGMLALPVATAPNGFLPSTCVMTIAWLAMTVTALLLVEAGFWMKKDEAHVISMSNELLGKWGKSISWVIYLFIGYASLVAYTAGSGHLLTKSLHKIFDVNISKEWGCVIFTCIFGPTLYLRHTTLGKINSGLFMAMVGAYIALIFLGSSEIRYDLVTRASWNKIYTCLPLLLTAFSFQTMVPSLHPYLDHHKPSLKVAIIGGTTLAFVVYLVWQLVVLGTVPLDGPQGLGIALKEGEPATHFLGAQVNNPWIETCATFFAFFALVTSFFGIGLGLYDFLSDGLNIPKKGMGSLTLVGLILIPVLISSVSLERIFLLALDATGGFGDTILNGMMPVLMVWAGRYCLKKEGSSPLIRGGKVLLICVFCFYLSTFFVELFLRSGHLTAVHDVRELNLIEAHESGH